MKKILIILSVLSLTSGCGLAIVSKADKEFLKAIEKINTASQCAQKIAEIPECQETAENVKDLVK